MIEKKRAMNAINVLNVFSGCYTVISSTHKL